MDILTHYLESYRNLGDEWLEEVWIDSAHPFSECTRREEIYS